MRNASQDGRAAYSRFACRSNKVVVDHLPLHEACDEDEQALLEQRSHGVAKK
jgi:hypothetical protein